MSDRSLATHVLTEADAIDYLRETETAIRRTRDDWPMDRTYREEWLYALRLRRMALRVRLKFATRAELKEFIRVWGRAAWLDSDEEESPPTHERNGHAKKVNPIPAR